MPPLARAAPIAGYLNRVPDADGLVRGVALIAELDGKHDEPLALVMCRGFTGGPAVLPAFSPERWLPRDYSARRAFC